MSLGSQGSFFLGSSGAGGGGGGYEIQRSLRFNDDDSSYLNKTFSSSGNRRTFTFSFWAKLGDLAAQKNIITASSTPGASNASSPRTEFRFTGNGGILFATNITGSSWSSLSTTAVFRDPSAWYHVVVAVDTTQATESNRVKIYVNGVQELWSGSVAGQNDETPYNNTYGHAIGAYANNYNDFFDGYLAEFISIDGQALAPSDFGEFDSNSVWQPKVFEGTYGTNGFKLDFSDTSSDAALGTDTSGNGNTWTVNNLIADVSGSVYAIAVDGNDKVAFPGVTIGTGDFTVECFFNQTGSTSGVQRIFSHTYGDSGDIFVIRLIDGGISMYLGSDYYANSTVLSGWHHAAIARSGSTVSFYLDGTRRGTATNSGNITFANVNVGWGNSSEYFIGEAYGCRITKEALYSGASYTVPTSAITTTSQGATASNVVHLSATTSTVTTNSGTTANGTASGDPTAVVGSPFGDPSDIDALRDTPVNGDSANDTGAGGEITGNYATLNPIMTQGTAPTVTNGNLDAVGTSQGRVTGTFGLTSGKWYFEVTRTTYSDIGNHMAFGVMDASSSLATTAYGGNPTSSGGNAQEWVLTDRATAVNNSTYTNLNSTLGNVVAGDVVQICVDMDNKKIWFGKNNTFSGVPASATGEAFSNLPATVLPLFYTDYTGLSFNGGQRSWAYAAPTNFKALCTANLSYPLIADGSTAFDTKLWSGNSTYPRSITGLNFSPDLIWLKNRTSAYDHVLMDAIRGTGTTKWLSSNLTSAEGVNYANANVTSLDANGFTIGSTAGTDILNQSGTATVGWAWDAGSSTVTNTDGSISSQVRANPSAGFSIVTYTGAANSPSTIGHGLNAVPRFVIVKPRTTNDSWVCYHSAFNDLSKYIVLNSTNAVGTAAANYWGTSSDWTSTTFGVYPAGGANNNLVGVSTVAYCFAPVSAYSAFGSYVGNQTSYPFVYTGFKPAWLLLKASSRTGDWVLVDAERNTSNVVNYYLYPNSSGAESTYPLVDFLSNGFKLQYSGGLLNENSQTYIWAAFASHPFKTARAR